MSVLIPLYNGIEYLEECVLSVNAQIFSQFECIIGVNGHGTDGGECMRRAEEIVRSLEDKRFRVVNLPNVRGAPSALNALVEMAAHEWVAHLDADDKWHPMKLHCQVGAVEQNPNIDICGTWCQYFGDWDGSPQIPGGFVPREVFHQMNPMIHSSIFIRRELAHYTDEFLVYDYDCWVRNWLTEKVFYNVPLRLTFHRLYPQSHFNASGKQRPDLVRLKYLGHS